MGFNPVDLAFGNMEALRASNERLRAENAKLRERIHELEMEGSDHFYRTAYAEDANRTLEAENAKLRELVDYMTPIAWYGASERERDRMRELGVDV